MHTVTRRAALAAVPALAATPLLAAGVPSADDSGLFDLVAQWWRFENAVNNGELTDEENDSLTDRQHPIACAIAATPTQTIRGLSAKLGVYREYSTASMESAGGGERVLASAMQDAERLAGGAV